MTTSYYIVAGVCFLTLVGLLWMEYQRRDRSWRPARMITTALAVAALAGILLRFTYGRRIDSSKRSEGVLLTEGYSPDSLQAWLKDHPQQQTTTPATYAATGDPSTLHVFGYGLTKDQWTELPPASLVLHPSPPPAGILEADWQRKLLPGRPLQIQGVVAMPPPPAPGATPRPFKLLLTASGATLDSLLIDGANTGLATGRLPFQLSTIPAPLGPALYQLLLIEDKDTLEREDIPVEVLPGKALNILMVAASPGWENSFLQKWLSKEGQGVAVRTAVSREKFDVAFVNLPPIPIDHLSANTLDHFDIVVVDAPSLSSFSAMERSVLCREIADRGLGLIIRIDSAGKPGLGAGGPEPIEVVTTKDSARTPYIKDRPGLQPLFRDSGKRILVAAGLYGKGKLIFTTHNTTWSQALAGEGTAYATWWSELLGDASQDKEPEAGWQMQPTFPAIGEPVSICLQSLQSQRSPPSSSGFERSLVSTSSASLPMSAQPQGRFVSQTVSLAQDPVFSFFRQGTYWPSSSGWQFTHNLPGDSTRWYSWPTNAWQGLRRQQRWNETRQYIASRHGRRNQHSVTGQRSLIVAIPVPKVIFFVIFILCTAFLWAERKMEWMSGRIVR